MPRVLSLLTTSSWGRVPPLRLGPRQAPSDAKRVGRRTSPYWQRPRASWPRPFSPHQRRTLDHCRTTGLPRGPMPPIHHQVYTINIGEACSEMMDVVSPIATYRVHQKALQHRWHTRSRSQPLQLSRLHHLLFSCPGLWLILHPLGLLTHPGQDLRSLHYILTASKREGR